MRQIVLDTETTGINISEGNRIIEIGCVELINRKLTGNHYHQYINPERESEQGALEVHGITSDFLADKPLFTTIAKDFMDFVSGAELIIHNAPFDVGFLNHELKLDGNKYGLINDHCTVIDTLVMAKNMYPGQRNSLDALCKRLGIENFNRELHGALLDSEILAEVYLLITGGQRGLELGAGSNDASGNQTAEEVRRVLNAPSLPVIPATSEEVENHKQYLEFLDKKSDGQCLWLKEAN